MNVADLERIWQLAGAALVGLAIAAIVLHALGSGRARKRARRRTIPDERDVAPPATVGDAVIAPGGAMGWPFRRRGAESLRIQPTGADFHVLWRFGETAVAHLVVGDEGVARGMYEWLSQRFGTGTKRLEMDDDEESKERVLRKVLQRKPIRRRLAVVAQGALSLRVVEVVDGAVRSAARVVDLEEADELVDLLVDAERARALAAPPPVRVKRHRPAVAAALATIDQA